MFFTFLITMFLNHLYIQCTVASSTAQNKIPWVQRQEITSVIPSFNIITNPFFSYIMKLATGNWQLRK